MKRTILISLLSWAGVALSAHAQDNSSAEEQGPRPATSVFTLQLGQGKVRDTYLTNVLYSGTSITLQYERWRLMSHLRWSNQQILNLTYINADDRGQQSSCMSGRLRYRYAMHRKWSLADERLSLLLGPYAGLDVGFNYNLKMAGSNNPATARVGYNLGGSVAAVGHYTLRRQPCSVMFQVQAPFLGHAFAPEYGASYYETFYLDHTSSDMHFTSLHNQQDLDVRLTTDVPLSVIGLMKRFDTTMRLGAAYHIETMHINDIITRCSTFEAVLGFAFQYLPYSRSRAHLLKQQAYEAY